MKNLHEYKKEIQACSKCGLCQSVCPIYKITKNDCSVSRGFFIMLKGLIKGDLNNSSKLNKYLDMCLKCGACSKFCPAGIDAVSIISSAKAEFFEKSFIEKFISFIQKVVIFDLCIKLLGYLRPKTKSKNFTKKVLFFGGCGSRLKGNRAVVKILNALFIEVVSPNFDCCGIPFYVKGDKKTYNEYKQRFEKIVKKEGITDIVTTCASCEKTLKEYGFKEIQIKNIYEYIKENNLKLSLKKGQKVTYHKPCNIDNFETIKLILKNTENLEYVEMQEYNSCCGLSGLTKFSLFNIMKDVFIKKHRNIIKTKAKYVLTSCLGCETALKAYSFGRYKVCDLSEFLSKNIV